MAKHRAVTLACGLCLLLSGCAAAPTQQPWEFTPSPSETSEGTGTTLEYVTLEELRAQTPQRVERQFEGDFGTVTFSASPQVLVREGAVCTVRTMEEAALDVPSLERDWFGDDAAKYYQGERTDAIESGWLRSLHTYEKGGILYHLVGETKDADPKTFSQVSMLPPLCFNFAGMDCWKDFTREDWDAFYSEDSCPQSGYLSDSTLDWSQFDEEIGISLPDAIETAKAACTGVSELTEDPFDYKISVFHSEYRMPGEEKTKTYSYYYYIIDSVGCLDGIGVINNITGDWASYGSSYWVEGRGLRYFGCNKYRTRSVDAEVPKVISLESALRIAEKQINLKGITNRDAYALPYQNIFFGYASFLESELPHVSKLIPVWFFRQVADVGGGLDIIIQATDGTVLQ
ncbi:MAG: hypothetical protein PHD32_12445 [Eubacteriales bacterium]|nr:hypothetical protein [Eubacteriales bacterium]